MESEQDPREQYANWKAPDVPSFRQTAAEYTRALRGLHTEADAENQAERDYITYIDRQFAKIRPEKPPQDFEVAEALAEAAADNANIRDSLQYLPEEERGKYQKIQEAAKNLFMESGRIVFPDATPLEMNRGGFLELSRELNNFSRNFQAISAEAESLPTLVSLKGQVEMEKEFVSRRNPEELLRVLDGITTQASAVLKEYARLNYNVELETQDETRLKGQGGVLAEYVKLIYRMELARDNLAQKAAITVEKKQAPEGKSYERVTDTNFEQYRAQGRKVEVNGLAWQLIDAYPDGRVILERQRTKEEMLESAKQAKEEGSTLLPSSRNHRVVVSRDDLKSAGRWIAQAS